MNYVHSLPRLVLFLTIIALTLSTAGNLDVFPGASCEPPASIRYPQNPEKDATNVVNVDFVVFHKNNGEIITGLKKANFAVFLDGVQKDMIDFSTPDRPIMASLIVESRNWGLPIDGKGNLGLEVTSPELLQAAELLLSQLIKSPQDEISVVAADMWPQPLTNLTNDPKRLGGAVDLLRTHPPVAPEIALFDTLKLVTVGGSARPPFMEESKQKTLDYRGLASVRGKRRAIILIASGVDTLSKASYKEASRIIQNAGVPIYVICTAGMLGPKLQKWLSAKRLITRLPGKNDLPQAETQLKAIAFETGGAYHPYTVETDGPGIVQSIKAMLSGQYNLAFSADDIRDGKAHKIEVKVDLDGDGVYDEQRFAVQARQVYNAPKK